MNAVGSVLLLACAGLLLGLPRRWALLPLLVGASYVPLEQGLEIGPVNMSVLRLLICVAFLRVVAKGERVAGGLKRLDWILVAWGTCFIFTGFVHKDPSAATILRVGNVSDCLGIYFLARVFIQKREELQQAFRMVCIVLIPVGVGMMGEVVTGKNLFGIAFDGNPNAGWRGGHVRARGPFPHAILAGTIGAACLPMAIALWRRERKFAIAGLAATSAMVVASRSSGPFLTVFISCGAMLMWKWRYSLRAVCWLTVFMLFVLHLIMNDPVYFLVARVDITGGSTGYHRAALIQSALEHFNEWWLIGTDFTRHWMPTGIYSNEDHTDITNHYIAMGVTGGMPLVLLSIAVLYAAFAAVAESIRSSNYAGSEEQFTLWILGAILFGHVTTFLAVSYFGQLLAFLYLLLGIIGSLQAFRTRARVPFKERQKPSLQRDPEFCHTY